MQEYVQPVCDLLSQAATGRSTVTFTRLIGLFPEATRILDIWETLDAACMELADLNVAIYSAVLSTKKDNLPGPGFFEFFHDHRGGMYKFIADDAVVPGLTPDQRREMAEIERLIVYAHAAGVRRGRATP